MKSSNVPQSYRLFIGSFAILLGVAGHALAADINTSALTENGWYSDDTRADGTGTQSAGTNLISPTLTDAPESGSGNPAHDADILSQVTFVIPPVPVPSGTHPGAAHLKIAPGSGSGKSQISHRDLGGHATGSVFAPGFSLNYSWMGDGTVSVTASVKFGIKTSEFGSTGISTRTGENAWDKVLIYEPGNLNGGLADGTWYTENVDYTTGKWWFFDRTVGAGSIGTPLTLSDMSTSAVMVGGRPISTVFALISDPGAIITSVQFGIGSGNAGGSVYVNELTTNFYRSGDKTTFGPIPPVHNVTQDTYHATIQSAINAATAGDLIDVAAGTYNESPVINKSLTLQGAGCGQSEIVLSGPTYLSAMEITGAGTSATISDFTITGYDAIGSGLASTNIIVYQPTGDTVIEDCCLNVGKRGPGTNFDDGFGLLTVYFDAAVVIDSITLDNCSLDPVTDGGRGFFVNPGVGVFTLMNSSINGLGSSFTQASDSLIEANTISGSGAASSRAGGIGTWGYPDPTMWGKATFRGNTITNAFAGVRLLSTEDCVVEENTISDCDYGVSVADFSQAFDPSSNVIFNNSIENTHFLAIENTEATVINASGNWLGSSLATTVAASVSPASVDYTPWLNSGSDSSGAPGFQSDFATVWVDDDSPQTGAIARVQEGVNLVSSSTVNVLPGLYEEQVVIDSDDLNLIGSGSGSNPAVDTIIKSPVSLTYSFNTGLNNFPIIGVHDCLNVSISDLRVDGAGRGNGNYRFQGIAYWNADGSVADCAITGIRETPLSGTQHGVGFYAFNNTGGPYSIGVTNCDVDDYQKNGFVLAGAGLTAAVVDCTVTGSGPLGSGLPAQNGIQVSTGAGGLIDGCTISNHQYTPATFASTGVLLFGAQTVDVMNSQITDNLPGVYVQDGDANVLDNEISNSAAPGTGDAIDIVNTTAFAVTQGGKKDLRRPAPLDVKMSAQQAQPRTPRSIDVTISGNTLVGADVTNTAGVYAYSASSILTIAVTDNIVRDWDYGIVADEDSGGVSMAANDNCILSNVTNGFFATGPTVQDATNNWWGDATGPLETTGTDEADSPLCYDPSTMVNADGLGDEVNDEFVNYCPWLFGKASLVLEVASTCPDDALPGEPGYQIAVELWMRDLLQDVTGFQAFLNYNTSVLSYRGDLSSYTSSPFMLHIQPIGSAEVTSGQINLDGSVNFGGSGTGADALLATLYFDVDMDCNSTVVAFGGGPLPSELSFEGDALPTGNVDTPSLALDDTAPVLVDPLDATFECDGAGNVADIAAWIASVTANDACDGVLVVMNDYTGLSDDCGATGSATVTFSAVDACGNTAQVVRTVTVEDTTPPMLTDPLDATFECDGSGNTADIAAWLATGTASDDCGSAMVTHDYTSLSDDCGETGSATVTFTAEDECGLTTQVVRTVTVQDTTPPMFTTDPGNATFECDGSGNVADIAAWLASAAASDDCGGVTITHDYTGLSDDCGETGTATVTFTAEDDCGLTTQVVRTVTVEDTTPPMFTTDPGNATFECDGSGNVADIAAWLASAAASDDCGGVMITHDYVGISDDCGETGTATVTFTAEDDCGLTTQIVRTVTVEDTTPPSITCPSDIVVNADAGLCTAAVDPGTASANDDCSAVTITGTRSDFLPLNDPYPTGVTTITWVAEDDCGLMSAPCMQTVTVNGVNDVMLTVMLAGVTHQGNLPGQTPLSFTRNIRFIAKNGLSCATPVCVPVIFTGTAGNMAMATLTIQVDCGVWTSICAKDPQHTLINEVGLTDTGTEYMGNAPLSLLGGDTDNDSDVDINDVTYFLFRFGTASVIGPGPCPYNGMRDADFSINGQVGLEDYTFLTGNWLAFSSCPCSALVIANVPTPPAEGALSRTEVTGLSNARGDFRTRVRTTELDAQLAVAADLNGDSVIDYQDVRLFEQQNGLPNDLSTAIEQSDRAARGASRN
jgi:parallel beta-helix repeat protein